MKAFRDMYCALVIIANLLCFHRVSSSGLLVEPCYSRFLSHQSKIPDSFITQKKEYQQFKCGRHTKVDDNTKYLKLIDCEISNNNLTDLLLNTLLVSRSLEYLRIIARPKFNSTTFTMDGVNMDMSANHIFDGIKEAYPKLTTVWIDGPLFIGQLQQDSLNGLDDVHNIFISNALITKIPTGLFNEFYNLKNLFIWDNPEITYIPSNLFSTQNKVEGAYFFNNGRSMENDEMTIHPHAFESSKNLKELFIAGENTEFKYSFNRLLSTLNGTALQKVTLCDINLARYYSSEQVYGDTSADTSTSLAKLGKIKSIELIGTGLSLTQLTHLFDGVSNLTHIDISNNNIPCEDFSKSKPCNCDLLEKISELISKVQNPILLHNFIYQRDEDIQINRTQFSYDINQRNLNKSRCSNKILLNKMIFLGSLLAAALVIVVIIYFNDQLMVWMYNTRHFKWIFPEEEKGDIVIVINADVPTAPFDVNVQHILQKCPGWTKKNEKYLLGREYNVKFSNELPVGGNMTDIIGEHIESCSRTIIILTPSFLQWYWSQHWFQVAYASSKLIVVELELPSEQENELKKELSKTKNTAIRKYMTSFNRKIFKRKSILKWTGDIEDNTFWRRLAYLLPHQHPKISRETEIEIGTPILPPTEKNWPPQWYYPDFTLNCARKKLMNMLRQTEGTFMVVDRCDVEYQIVLGYYLIVLHEAFKPYAYGINFSVPQDGDKRKLYLMDLESNKMWDNRIHDSLSDLIDHYKVEENTDTSMNTSNLKLVQPYKPS